MWCHINLSNIQSRGFDLKTYFHLKGIYSNWHTVIRSLADSKCLKCIRINN